MLRVTFEDGSVIEYRDGEVIEIEGYPPRDTPTAGWVCTREDPPGFRRATPLSINVLKVGKRVCTGGGFVKVTNIERV